MVEVSKLLFNNVHTLCKDTNLSAWAFTVRDMKKESFLNKKQKPTKSTKKHNTNDFIFFDISEKVKENL